MNILFVSRHATSSGRIILERFREGVRGVAQVHGLLGYDRTLARITPLPDGQVLRLGQNVFIPEIAPHAIGPDGSPTDRPRAPELDDGAMFEAVRRTLTEEESRHLKHFDVIVIHNAQEARGDILVKVLKSLFPNTKLVNHPHARFGDAGVFPLFDFHWFSRPR